MKAKWSTLIACLSAASAIAACSVTAAAAGKGSGAGLTLTNVSLNFAPGAGGKNSASAIQSGMGGAVTTGLLNYQGILKQSGAPMDGPTTVTFGLYFDESGGAPFWSETLSVNAQSGLFTAILGQVNPIPSPYFYFQLWLGVQPLGSPSELSPRAILCAAPYAFGVVPGATMYDTNVGIYLYPFYVESETHPAIYGNSHVNNGITGQCVFDPDPASLAPPFFAGVVGKGAQAHGVKGSTASHGWFYGSGATEGPAGVYGEATDMAYGGWFTSAKRNGLVVATSGTSYYTAFIDNYASGSGGWGLGVYGSCYMNNNLSVLGDLTVSGAKSGYVVDICLNDGDQPLEQGDVVVISGYDDPVSGQIPVPRVQKATAANATSVMGVVDRLYEKGLPIEKLQPGQSPAADSGFSRDAKQINPGQYLGVVTLGAFRAIKVDASGGPIKAGDLLATSGANTGHSACARPVTLQGVTATAEGGSISAPVTIYSPGTIVGRALGELKQGQGTVPVFVSAR